MMEGLQRSAVSFRRQGSSGLIWDDKFLSSVLNQVEQNKEEQQPKDKEIATSTTVGSADTLRRSQSNGGGRASRTGEVSPAIEPPSPKVSACGFCSALGKGKADSTRRRPKSGKRRT